MKNIITILFLGALCLLFSTCAKKNVFDLPPDHPVIDSLYPASGVIGDQIRLYGSGFSVSPSANKVTVNGVAFVVDSPSTSTVLLVHLVDTTGTGKVHVTVDGREGEGPVFTYGRGTGVGSKPRIVDAKRGWADGSGYSAFVYYVPPQNSDIHLKVNGVEVVISDIIRPTDPSKPVELRCSDASWEDHIPVNLADIIVVGAGVSSDVFHYQVPPRYPGLNQTVYRAGDTMVIRGHFFGVKTADSKVTFLYNGNALSPLPLILSWSNTEVSVKVPAYSNIPPNPAWGDRAGMGFTMQVGAIEALGINSFWYILNTSSVNTVSTLAGSTGGFADGQGTAALFNTPRHMVTDAQGNLYVADRYNNRIRKITPNGMVTTVAGNGTYGHRDGPAAAAMFEFPEGLAIDAQGNLYTSELNSNSIRKISTTGTVTTLAGDTAHGYADGKGSAARFSGPTDLVADGNGNIFVADVSNSRIRMITPDGTVTTVAGNGTYGDNDGSSTTAGFASMGGIIINTQGVLFVSDYYPGNKIRAIYPSGTVSTMAGDVTSGYTDGAGVAARFNLPYGLALDVGNSNNIYVADLSNHRIRRIAPDGTVTTLAGSGVSGSTDGSLTEASFNDPICVAVDPQGNVYVSGADNRIRKITLH
ncbi:MAG: IPT/TIG domain-containing protein [Chitinophagaceae bacterium]|nr:IPT/TIG domain-containing protein [Chitinophagaceae bacterium]